MLRAVWSRESLERADFKGSAGGSRGGFAALFTKSKEKQND